jgi:hypothetical protein
MLTFERQAEFAPLILEIWELLKQQQPKVTERLIGVQFVDEGSTYFTEPADHYAFQLR